MQFWNILAHLNFPFYLPMYIVLHILNFPPFSEQTVIAALLANENYHQDNKKLVSHGLCKNHKISQMQGHNLTLYNPTFGVADLNISDRGFGLSLIFPVDLCELLQQNI